MPTKKTKTISSKEPIAEDSFSLSMTSDEMFSLIQILTFSKDIFEQMAKNCAKDGDIKTEEVYKARSLLSFVLCSKFRTIVTIGEPESREVH